ncbi:retrovirus-related pol polyprotein from transposon TNT 1-94 [Tanacetum coccineum]
MVIEEIIWRQLWRSWQRSWVAVIEIMPIDQVFLGNSERQNGPLGSEEGPSTGPSTRPSTGPSTRPSTGPSTGPATGLRGEGGLLQTQQSFSEGHTPKGVGLRMEDSHTGNHREDDFTPLETFGGKIMGDRSLTPYIRKGCPLSLMHGPCSPCSKRSRLQRRLLAAAEAATEVVGCCEGCHIGYKLLCRLPHRLQAVGKASTELAGFCRGCHIGCCEDCHTAKKVETELDGSCGGCHISCRLLQRLNDAVKVATEVVGCCGGCHIAKKAASLLKRLQRR